jgi:mannosyl-oligosaccharide alpha-1,2-mannosidase
MRLRLSPSVLRLPALVWLLTELTGKVASEKRLRHGHRHLRFRTLEGGAGLDLESLDLEAGSKRSVREQRREDAQRILAAMSLKPSTHEVNDRVLESSNTDRDKAEHAEKVRSALRHFWQGYKLKSWGSDEVQPIAGGPGGKWGDVGMDILDSMDTLWLAGLHREFGEAEQWLKNLKFDDKPNGYRTSLFEVTIRGLGGLLSSYALTNHSIFLEKAEQLGGNLLQGFPSKKKGLVWPAAYLDIRKPSDQEPVASWLQQAILADIGTNLLEFTYLSEVSNDPSFEDAAANNEARLLELAAKKGKHLAPKWLKKDSLDYSTPEVSVGAFGDSYFEYLLKGYLQSGKKEERLLKEWKQAMREMRDSLISKSDAGYTFISTSPGSGQMEHLTCFMGGLLALASHTVPAEHKEDWWLPTAKEITHTCYEMYRQSPSGLAPEISMMEGQQMIPLDKGFRLRPETLESLFYLYRITGNETYRHWSSEIFDAINKNTRTKWGFANVQDVTTTPVSLVDTEETFMGAETLKYALLVHLPSSVLPLDKFVLNTEAHPLPIIAAAASNLL